MGRSHLLSLPSLTRRSDFLSSHRGPSAPSGELGVRVRIQVMTPQWVSVNNVCQPPWARRDLV